MQEYWNPTTNCFPFCYKLTRYCSSLIPIAKKSSSFQQLPALCIHFVVAGCEQTPKLPRVVKTSEVTELNSFMALSGGTIANDGNSVITARGVCWGEWVSPPLSDSCTVDRTGAGIFTSQLSGLKSGTRYKAMEMGTLSACLLDWNWERSITSGHILTMSCEPAMGTKFRLLLLRDCPN